MSLVIFEARGSIAHFRRPDTLGTHATYPFITRTALHGLVASVLGRDSLDTARCGVRLLSPILTVTQELSLHGKTWTAGSGKEAEFNRPTSIELLVNPAYRLYYHGPQADQFAELLGHARSHYHTYLGSAFCLTFPRLVRRVPESEWIPVELDPDRSIELVTVVPAAGVRKLQPKNGDEYARVGGLLYEHLGNRRFRGTVNVLYEVNGRPIRFLPHVVSPPHWQMIQVPDEGAICLW